MMNDRERMFYDFRGVPDEEDEKTRRALREPLLQSVAHAVNTWGIYQAERLSAFFRQPPAPDLHRPAHRLKTAFCKI